MLSLLKQKIGCTEGPQRVRTTAAYIACLSKHFKTIKLFTGGARYTTEITCVRYADFPRGAV